MKSSFKKMAAIGVLALGSVSANATLLTGELDADAYVSHGGYDLAWASPCSDGVLESSCSALDITEQSTYGWSIMTIDLFNSLQISAATFEVNYQSSNTQEYQGLNYAKASGWFSNQYSHIDVSDGLAGYWSFLDVNDGNRYYESIAYRAQSASVPEPATLSLLGLGLIGLGFARKQKKS
mgnify:FL=1